MYVITPKLSKAEHDRLDKEAEDWRRANPWLASLPPDPVYLLNPGTVIDRDECRRVLDRMREIMCGRV